MTEQEELQSLKPAAETLRRTQSLLADLNLISKGVRSLNYKWWVDLETGELLKRNKGELLMLIVSELAECLEGCRKGLPDSHLPHRSAEEVELADTLIRILDYAAGFNLDLAGAVSEKLAYNLSRQDHSIEARKLAHGKKF